MSMVGHSKPLVVILYRGMFLGLAWVLWSSGAAFGLQSHATPEEGFYSHQLGHVFFILSMVVFAFWLQKTRLVNKRGWRLIQMSCLFFILWNIDATLGHEVELWLEESRIVGPRYSRQLIAEGSVIPYLYFFLKLDHLLCVPAMTLLFFGLRKLTTESPEDPP
ncbi:MAG: hypothetical protein AB1512_02235 [Thermodesulfobacteriota bacterium]